MVETRDVIRCWWPRFDRTVIKLTIMQPRETRVQLDAAACGEILHFLDTTLSLLEAFHDQGKVPRESELDGFVSGQVVDESLGIRRGRRRRRVTEDGGGYGSRSEGRTSAAALLRWNDRPQLTPRPPFPAVASPPW
jgi:hypothetical protein